MVVISLLSHIRRLFGQTYCLTTFHFTMAAWRLDFFETTASAHEPVDDTEMPGVYEWVDHCHTLLAFACRHGTTLHS